jgi:DNA repair protein RadC
MAEAHSFILGHNHPSGDPGPSPADLAMTQRIASGARQIDCELLDHIIVSATGRWVSLKREYPDRFR